VIKYEEYITSMDWINRCRRFFGDAPWCARRDCRRRYREGNVQIHHRTYERLGHERIEDLVPLCDEHHGEAHRSAERLEEQGMAPAAALARATDLVLA
jgi:hypothetical protein